LILIDNFFQLYANVFVSFNSHFISDVYEFPMIFYTENGETVSMNVDIFTENTKKLITIYEQIGVKKVAFKIESNTVVSQSLNLVSIIWIFKDSDNKEIYNATTRYVMKETVSGLKIKSVFVVNETSHLNKLLTP
jgi:prolyl-tRNA synthetase